MRDCSRAEEFLGRTKMLMPPIYLLLANANGSCPKCINQSKEFGGEIYKKIMTFLFIDVFLINKNVDTREEYAPQYY